jgi:hypothetical protein
LGYLCHNLKNRLEAIDDYPITSDDSILVIVFDCHADIFRFHLQFFDQVVQARVFLPSRRLNILLKVDGCGKIGVVSRCIWQRFRFFQ